MADFLKRDESVNLIERLDSAGSVEELDSLIAVASEGIRRIDESAESAEARLLGTNGAIYGTWAARKSELLRASGVTAA